MLDNLDSRFDHLVDQGLDKIAPRAGQPHISSCHRRSHREGAGLNAVGDHRVGRAVQTADPRDMDRPPTGSGHFCPHGVQAIGQIRQFRLCGGVFQHCVAIGQNSRQYGVLCRPYRIDRKTDHCTFQAPGRLRIDVAFVHVDFGTQRFQRHKVQVHRPCTNGAAAG